MNNQLKMDKRAYTAYYSYLLQQQKNGELNVNGHTIEEELIQVKNHIDNIDLMIMRYENEQIDN